MDRTKALERLESGNNRFSNERLQNKSFRDVRLTTAANGQEPFATVLACADSRVPVEYVFDQGLGDLLFSGLRGISAIRRPQPLSNWDHGNSESR